jgi:hypothetical protein
MSGESETFDDFSWIRTGGRSIACSVCNVEDDVETLSSKLRESIRDFEGVKAICENLRKDLAAQMEAHKDLLDRELGRKFELHKLEAIKDKLEKKLANSQATFSALESQLEAAEEEVQGLVDAARERESVLETLHAAEVELSQAASYTQDALLAQRHSAALEVFLCIPIIPDDSVELEASTSTNKAPTISLKGHSTIYGLPFPNNGQVRGIPCEISQSVLSHVAFLCSALCAVYHISCPHPLHVFDHAECAIVEDGSVPGSGPSPGSSSSVSEGGGYVSVQRDGLSDDFRRGGIKKATGKASASEATTSGAKLVRYYYLSPGIKLPAGATSNGVPIGHSVNEQVQQRSSSSEMPSLFTPSTSVSSSFRGSSSTSGCSRRVNSRAPWDLPSTLRNPDVEFTEDGWTRAGGGAGAEAAQVPVRLVENTCSRSTHPLLTPVSTNFPAALALLQEDVLYLVRHILSVCGHTGPCFPREAMLLNLHLAQKVCVKQANEMSRFLSARNLVEDSTAAAAAEARTAVNDIFTYAESSREGFGPCSTSVSRYQMQLQLQHQYILEQLQK